ncbi:MAG: NAD-dependent epimerase/dehydratase family protein [Verrucomicrobiae bacterium]|nr:NAD-dependent epimerase/dehydratase family protein [Verrucomicrobiae bacterium]
MAEQVLVTGGTGFIGRHLVRRLIEQGFAVRLFARSSQKVVSLFDKAVDVVEGDLESGVGMDRACQDVATIFHVAGIYRFGLRGRKKVLSVNVGGTEQIMQAAWRARVNQVVHLSSAGILSGPTRALTEKDYPYQIPKWSVYKFSKWRSEQIALNWAKRGLPVVIASAASPIGAEDERPTPTGQIIRDFLLRRFPCSCRAGLNFLDVQDLADGMIATGKKGRLGERYILAGENLWLQEFLGLLSKITGLPAPRWVLPWGLIMLGGMVGEAVSLMSQQGLRLNLETAWQAKNIQFFKTRKAHDELGWKPKIAMEESIKKSVTWFQQRLAQEFSGMEDWAVDRHVS